jgi:aspartate/tyrosine/aromatic aminotransferase
MFRFLSGTSGRLASFARHAASFYNTPGRAPNPAAISTSAAAGALIARAHHSMFAAVPQEPADRILGLNTAYRADTDPNKVNLGVGAYRTNAGSPYILPVVLKVEQEIIRDFAEKPAQVNHEYTPQSGLPEFGALSAAMLFGADSPVIREKRIATFQALSGTGALRVAFEFVRKLETLVPGTPRRDVYIPNPTWSNHKNTVKDAGLEFKEYRYLDHTKGAVDIDAVCEDLENAPEGSLILFHACAHNPSGADPSHEEWARILKVVQKRKHLPLFDSAYQGFASGSLADDAFAVRMFAETGMDMLTCQSYAKNAGLYGERVGALTMVSSVAEPVAAIKSQVDRIIRGMYSSPPVYGARIMSRILGDPKLFADWENELVVMSSRIKDMRKHLFEELLKLGGERERWERITKQIGMFSYTGLSTAEVEYMRTKFHVYMTDDGRISMAGLNESNVDYVARAMLRARVAKL